LDDFFMRRGKLQTFVNAVSAGNFNPPFWEGCGKRGKKKEEGFNTN
jgi:hypothetical protein